MGLFSAADIRTRNLSAPFSISKASAVFPNALAVNRAMHYQKPHSSGMNPVKFVQGRLLEARQREAIRQLVASAPKAQILDWSRSLSDPTAYYKDAVVAFHRELPESLREHRVYFKQSRRGFGEDAFHTMWHMLMERFRFAQFLEIGVYRGQTLSLISLLQKQMAIPDAEVWGISPFTSAGDSVSKYLNSVNYQEDTLANFAHFHLPPPKLLKAFSTDQQAIELIKSRQWDAIYIDGNHDYEVARADWENCAPNVRKGGVIVLDDSSLQTNFEPPIFASKGHPGPSRLASEINPNEFQEILRVGHNRVFQKR